jgi:hypothetical protein
MAEKTKKINNAATDIALVVLATACQRLPLSTRAQDSIFSIARDLLDDADGVDNVLTIATFISAVVRIVRADARG